MPYQNNMDEGTGDASYNINSSSSESDGKLFQSTSYWAREVVASDLFWCFHHTLSLRTFDLMIFPSW